MSLRPIILAHGIARFDVIAPTILEYWNDTPALLRSLGYRVETPEVSWVGPVDRRAKQLASAIRKLLRGQWADADRLHIVAHSMGGLDARVAIAELVLGPRVASLTTLSTPHHGTPVADLADRLGFDSTIGPLLRTLRLDVRGLLDLTTDSCRERNARLRSYENRNPDGIRYRTYAGVQDSFEMFLPLLPTHQIVRHAAGPNDGLVPASSASWKDGFLQAVVDFDHLNILGWWDPSELFSRRTPARFRRDVRRLYQSIARGLPE